MLSILRDFQGTVYWKLLPRNSTINAKPYCKQLDNLKAAPQVNRRETRKIRLLDDNAKAHTAKVTRQKLEELGWEILPHPAYWPYLAPFDYHLFRLVRIYPVTSASTMKQI